MRIPSGLPRRSTSVELRARLELLGALQVGQVAGDRHHHPEDRRDPGEQRQRDQQQHGRRFLSFGFGGRGPRPAAVAGRRSEARRMVGAVVVAHWWRRVVARRSAPRTEPRLPGVRRRRGRTSSARSGTLRAPAPRLRLALESMPVAASDPASQAAFLTRNAAESLPAGALEQRLAKRRARGPAAAREARPRPDRAGHPPRPHRRAPEAARVPGPRASRSC